MISIMKGIFNTESKRVKFKSHHPQNKDIYIFVSEGGEEFFLYVGEGTKVKGLDRFFMDTIYDTKAVVDYVVDNEGVRHISKIVSYKL